LETNTPLRIPDNSQEILVSAGEVNKWYFAQEMKTRVRGKVVSASPHKTRPDGKISFPHDVEHMAEGCKPCSESNFWRISG
jgi:hypothetical protein